MMSVVKIDERGRVTLPKLMRDSERAVVIPAGSFAVVIPVPRAPEVHAANWLSSKRSGKELKHTAEKRARDDAVKRAKRHRQL
jgi:bifunctional DNA-binding transcriptional regulator/antitoxin component of YhaV-PrlF toxin-antitoxin module